MNALLNKHTVHIVFDDLEMAAALVAHLEEHEKDGWNYLLKTAPDGKTGVIEMYDENGHLLGLV